MITKENIMQTANIFTPMQVMILREAAATTKDKIQAIDGVIALLKLQNPEKFFHDKGGKPDPALRNRTFYDEPRNLELSEYKSAVVPYAGINQAKLHKARGSL